MIHLLVELLWSKGEGGGKGEEQKGGPNLTKHLVRKHALSPEQDKGERKGEKNRFAKDSPEV